jgi:shikimate kinase
MNIVLIGFMGAGKTTIGRLLAKDLNRKFYDCDNLILQKMEMTIDQIFRLYGEIKFRAVETEILTKLTNLNNIIIATGGGAITRYRNIELIKKNGIVVYLYADLLVIYERIIKDKNKRPLLGKENTFNEMVKLITTREELYKKVADITIDTSTKTPDETLKEIKIKLKERKII